MKTKTLSFIALRVLFSINAYAQLSDTTVLPESASLLSTYIQYVSVSGNENEAGEFLASQCRSKGFHVEVFDCANAGYNFAASLYPLSEGKPNILFLNHIDVVPTGPDSTWAYLPYSGTVYNNIVWGRGAIDMKGMAIMQLLAMEEFSKSFNEELPFNITLLSLSREEVDNGGAKAVTDKFFEQLNPMVVFGEGGAGVSGLSAACPDQVFFTVSVAEKNALWLRLTLKIPSSGHGSVPPLEYTNQEIIKILSRLIDRKIRLEFDETTSGMLKILAEYEKGIRKRILRKPLLNKPLLKPSLSKEPLMLAALTNTITITNITNPVLAPNQIAQEVQVMLDCRLLPGTNREEFIRWITELLQSNKIEIEVIQHTPSATPTAPGFYFQEFKRALQLVYPQGAVMPILFPAYTDNNYFRQHQVPVYGINPVHLSKDQLQSVHKENEHISIDQLESGKLVYVTFLRNLVERNQVIAQRKSVTKKH